MKKVADNYDTQLGDTYVYVDMCLIKYRINFAVCWNCMKIGRTFVTKIEVPVQKLLRICRIKRDAFKIV